MFCSAFTLNEQQDVLRSLPFGYWGILGMDNSVRNLRSKSVVDRLRNRPGNTGNLRTGRQELQQVPGLKNKSKEKKDVRIRMKFPWSEVWVDWIDRTWVAGPNS